MTTGQLLHRESQAIVFGMQPNAVQRMLDFDYACRRDRPSVAAVINPTGPTRHPQELLRRRRSALARVPNPQRLHSRAARPGRLDQFLIVSVGVRNDDGGSRRRPVSHRRRDRRGDRGASTLA